MSFIAKHITHHDERLIYIARLHWIYLIKGISWFFLLAGTGAFINWKIVLNMDTLPSETMPFIAYPFTILVDFIYGIVPLTIGTVIFLVYLFKVLGTEIGLTNKRMIYKTGLFFVQSSEVELAEVSEAKVDNGMLGTWLGYGQVNLDCRFVGDFTLPIISHPYKILRQINKLRGHMAETELTTKV